MRLGLIIPHKTKVAIALWRRNTKEFKAPPCVSIGGFFYSPRSFPAHSFSFILPPPSPSENVCFHFFNFQFISIITYMRVRTTWKRVNFRGYRA